MPMVLEEAPTTCDRLVLAGRRRIIGQPDGEPRLRHEGDEPLHTLGAPAVLFGAIIQMESEGRDGGEALADCLQQIRAAMSEGVARTVRWEHSHHCITWSGTP